MDEDHWDIFLNNDLDLCARNGMETKIKYPLFKLSLSDTAKADVRKARTIMEESLKRSKTLINRQFSLKQEYFVYIIFL